MSFLRGCVVFALGAGGALYGDSAFASCGDRGRNCQDDPTEMRRIEVIGQLNPFDVDNPCFGTDCDVIWDDPPDEGGDSGGGSTPIPLPEDPPPSPPEDLDDRCARVDGSLPIDIGGGSFSARLCWRDGDVVLVECNDYPQWGGSGCPAIP